MQIIKYQTEEQAEQIIKEKLSQNLILIEVQNIKEGNFLGFAKKQITLEEQQKEITTLKQQISALGKVLVQSRLKEGEK